MVKNIFRVDDFDAYVRFPIPKLFFIQSSRYKKMSDQVKYAYSLLNEYLEEFLIEKIDQNRHVYICQSRISKYI